MTSSATKPWRNVAGLHLFIINAIGYFVFVVLVIAVAAVGVSSHSITGLEWIIFVYVIAFAVEEVVEIRRTSPRRYIKKWTNWFDIGMLLLYILYFILRFDSVSKKDELSMKVAHHFFGVAAFVTCLRFLYYVQLYQKIGIVQISFSKVIPETVNFLVVLAIFLLAFSVWITAVQNGATYSLPHLQTNDSSTNGSSTSAGLLSIVNATANGANYVDLGDHELSPTNRYVFLHGIPIAARL